MKKKSPKKSTKASKKEPEYSAELFMPYLLEVRKRVAFAIAIFVVAAGLGFFYYEHVIRFALNFFNLEGVNIVFTSPFQFINLAFTSALLVGFVVVFPFLVIQILLFTKPALGKNEYKAIKWLMLLGIILFTSGMIFGVVIMRYIITIFYQQSISLDIGNFLDVSRLLSQILLTGTAMGIAFQFPIALTILLRYGAIKYQDLVQQRLYAYALSLVFAALLPPTDLLSLFLLTIPLLVLFELTLFVNKYVLKAHLL